MTRPTTLLRRLGMPALAALLLSAAPLHAQTAPPPDDPAGRCSPTVSAALGAWDTGLAAAERFGDKAVAVAREKGREYLLPLLGIDPKTAQPDARGGDTTDDVGRALEESRDDPQRRAALCAAITRAADEAKSSAGAGLDALRRALDNWQLSPPATPAPAPTPTPTPAPPKQDGLIRT
ncbi:hypothetical protein SAMN02982917_0248 [Azospirillum oryzae]|uniref:Uncharacterized protein n=1 Tax=Azospirillum oryzae TaxID=286727 RepID=A0A1X7HSE0_9PROT|nr:hypothetical protein [Azospirillum oryzae]SMF91469.1 hypothetical protein SAMN02982917_0248 [Azospirillum oryzae]